jgi:hypothetical protein
MKSQTLFTSLLTVSSVFAVTIYVDCDASSSGSGTEYSPFNSLAQVNSHTFSAGDILTFKKNTTCQGVLYPQGSGTAESPITITSYGWGDLPVIDAQGAAQAVLLVNQDNWHITNIAATNPADNLAARNGINVVYNDTNVHSGLLVENCVIFDVAGQTNKATEAADFEQSCGIAVTGTVGVGTRIDNVLVTQNFIRDCGGGGIKVRTGQQTNRGLNTRVSYNDIESCGGDGIVIEYSQTPLIDHNTAGYLGYGKYPYTGGNFAGMWVLGCSNSTLQFNVVHNTMMSEVDSEAFDCDWGNDGYCLIEYNFSHDNAGGMFLNCDGCGGTPQGTHQIVRYNIFQNDCRTFSNGDEAKLSFYNNVVYCPDKEFEISVPPSTNFTNNIFVGMQNATLPTGSGIEWFWNVFQTVSPPTDNGITGDPEFLNPGSGRDTLISAGGYKLKSSSPALNNGAVIADNGGRDFFGYPVNSNSKPNRGAYNGPGL